MKVLTFGESGAIIFLSQELSERFGPGSSTAISSTAVSSTLGSSKPVLSTN